MEQLAKRLSTILLMLFAPLTQAGVDDWADYWDYYTYAHSSDLPWQPLTSNVQMDIGLIQDAYWAEAWRYEGEVGVMLKYIYAEPVSPPELPAGGSLKEEQVEVTFNCINRTSQIGYMYLYDPQGKYIGNWFDPNAGPTAFDSGSIVSLAYTHVCQ